MEIVETKKKIIAPLITLDLFNAYTGAGGSWKAYRPKEVK
jgi:hypothetical protein